MLVVILGAGASFDSNPLRPPRAAEGTEVMHRPPLAASLFDWVDRPYFQAAVKALPRVSPALMEARATLKAGGTIEDALTRLWEEQEAGDPRARAQLMAVRFYLQQVLTVGPDAWEEQANYQTSYVSLLAQLARWQRDTAEPYTLVTFNYDLLLERARAIVYGAQFTASTLGAYVVDGAPHILKPHGSVNWAEAAKGATSLRSGDDAKQWVCDNSTEVTPLKEYAVRAHGAAVVAMEDSLPSSRGGAQLLTWLPMLAIPVEGKPGLVMDPSHIEVLKADLAQATAVLAIGWRAAEEHFLRLLQDHLPSRRSQVYAVSHSRKDAQETIRNLWSTGRFDQSLAIDGGFSQFADAPAAPGAYPTELPGHLVLGDVLRRQTGMDTGVPGAGVLSHPPVPRSEKPYRSFAP